MKKNTKANRIDEKHSNMALVTSMISLIALTFVMFVYNAYFTRATKIIMAQNMMLVVSIISYIAGVALIFVTNKKDIFCFEYSVFFLVMSLGLFTLYGVPIITMQNAFYATVAFIVIYWIATIAVHCFVLPTKGYPKKLVNSVLIALAVAVPVIMAYCIYVIKSVEKIYS